MNLKTNMLHENKDIAQVATATSFSIYSISTLLQNKTTHWHLQNHL
jgi:hypothetical protein